MRTRLQRDFVVELVSLLALVITVALAWGGNLLTLPTEVVVSASIGIAVAAYIWALKWELKREFEDKLEIYTLLEKIEDEDLHKRGLMAIERCKVELENLSKGVLQLESGQLFRYLIQVSNSARYHIRTTHVGLDEKYIEILQTAGESQWHQHNAELVRKGIRFERFFILKRNDTVIDESNRLRKKIKEILEEQQNNGIEVRIVWQEELDNEELVQDFVIFDDDLALVTNPSWTTGYSNVIVYRRKYNIDHYSEVYEALRSISHSISAIEST